MTTVCQICGQEFYTKKSRIKNGRGKFCSRRCDAFSKTKSYNFDQGFGRRLRYSGYIERNDPKTRRRRKEHVWIAEEVLGRKLIKPEEVHHIDGDKTNNKNSNLLVCSKSYHKWLHANMAVMYQIKHFKRKIVLLQPMDTANKMQKYAVRSNLDNPEFSSLYFLCKQLISQLPEPKLLNLMKITALVALDSTQFFSRAADFFGVTRKNFWNFCHGYSRVLGGKTCVYDKKFNVPKTPKITDLRINIGINIK